MSDKTTNGDFDYRDPIECEYSLTECRHPMCDCPRQEINTTAGWRENLQRHSLTFGVTGRGKSSLTEVTTGACEVPNGKL